MATTLSVMQARSFSSKLVCAIEGCEFLLSDAPSASVITAWAAASGGDWTSCLPGLFVDIHNEQKISPHEPFTGGGSCVVRVLDTDHTDLFGKLVNKRAAGAETVITATIDRNDTTIPVKGTTNFTSSGVAYCGTEAMSYTGKTSTSLTSVVRGKWSPFGPTANARYGNHHRKGQDTYHVQLAPVVSQLPRVWIGKRIGIWLHTWDETTETMNSRADAQLIFAGRIEQIADDAQTFHTVIDCKHVNYEVQDAVIGKDMWAATVADGMYLVTGRQFTFADHKAGSAVKQANALTVVASGASGANQINADYYTTSQLCEKINTWLDSEKAAARIYGSYRWASPVTSNVGLRTKVYWTVTDAGALICEFSCVMPGEVSAFLGLHNETPGETGVSAVFSNTKTSYTNTDNLAQGEGVPFVSLVFRPTGPGRLGQEFAEAIVYSAENERGTFIDQYAWFPSEIKENCTSDRDWGLFILDEKSLMVGSYDANNNLSSCWLAPFQLTADNSTEAHGYIGRRADEPETGPLTLRQVFIFESSMENLLNSLMYSSGTAAYNHATYDTLPYGFGVGLPGALLANEWERTVSNLPGAQAPLLVVIEEPTKLSDLIASDLRIRWAFLRWRDQHLELAQWQTPLRANAATSIDDVTLTLSDANKAAPAGEDANHRIPSLESSEYQRPVVKIDYCRDFAVGRNDQYLKSIQMEDQTAVDDGGGNAKPMTLKMRNTYSQWSNTGAGVESLLPQYLALMPTLSRASRMVTRSIDQRYFEGYAPGDVAIVNDLFARDPLTGARGILNRAALITRLSYDLGGPSWSGGDPRPQSGSVDLFFLDTHRGEIYSPCAQVDDTQSNSGYNAGTGALTCYAQKYSHSLSLAGWRGTLTWDDPADASNFEAGDEIVIIEMDPPTAASPVTWTRTIATVAGNVITPTTTLSAPAWDSTKKYRIISAPYTSASVNQQDDTYQADTADLMVLDTEVAYHYNGDQTYLGYVANTGLEKFAKIPTLAYGDGKPQDVGHDRQLCYNLNALIDYKTAHQAPMLCTATKASLGGPAVATDWVVEYCYPLFFGTESLSTTVTRSLTVAPWIWSTDGTSVGIRVTLSRTFPTVSSGTLYASGNPARFTDQHAQASWTTTSTSEVQGADATLSIGVKDLFFGFAFVVIEVNNTKARCRGLSKCIEGPRTT